jgi:hypothetical protein
MLGIVKNVILKCGFSQRKAFAIGNQRPFVEVMAEQPDIVESLSWDASIDTLLAGWCDNAKCFEWMHSEASSLYEKRSKVFMITSNCITAFAGISNVIAGGNTLGSFQISWFFGGLSILVSTFNIIQDKLGYAQRAVLHAKAASSWAMIRSKIEEAVTVPYSARKDCKTFMKYIKADMNTVMMEGNSIIPAHIKKACYERFNAVERFDIPDICGQLEHTKIYIDLKEPLI